MAHQNYYCAPSHQSQQQQYSDYPTQRPASTDAASQYASQNHHVSQSSQSYSTQAYAPSGTSYNLSDYSYGPTNYGASSGACGTARNTASDLQNLAYASGLHDSVQRTSTQATAAQSNDVSYTHNSHPGYGQQQQRPKSVNSLSGNSSQRSPATNSRQLNNPELPFPTTGYQASGAQSSSSQQRTMTPPQVSNAYRAAQTVQQTAQASDPSRAITNTAQPTQTMATSSAYQWSGQHHTHTDTSGSRNFETVDPTQVYDPWPEIQRKREAARAAKALEERAQAEREIEEARLAEERRKVEEDQNLEQGRQERQEDERMKEARAAQQAQKAQEQRQKKANTNSKVSKAAAAANLSTSASAQNSPQEIEARMRALMAQMRELNGQDPALLAKIWEEESQTHNQPSQTTPQAVQYPRPSAQQTNNTATQRNLPSAQPRPSSNMHAPLAQIAAPAQAPTRQPQQHPPQQQVQPAQQQPATTGCEPPKRAPPSGTTAWPHDKIDQISKAAADWLNGVPENHNKRTSPQEIRDLLNRNPKYVELCNWLESNGLKLERASFARALLAAVPDINSKVQAQPSPTGQVNGSTQLPPVAAVKGSGRAGPQSTPVTAHSNHQAGRPSTVGERLQGARSYPPPEQTQFRSPYFVPTPGGTPTSMHQAIPTPPPQVPVAPMPYTRHDRHDSGSRQGSSQREDSSKPATKADAVRKRNFSDIVDLTQLSDDEEPPAKKQVDFNNDIAPPWAAPPDSTFYPHQPGQSRFQLPTMVHADDRTKNMDVAQPLNRKYALRRSNYEVKTIARDILLATGKHPEMRPLNGHLEVLKESFKVDNTSDLSTLRWDLIDPGDPPAEALKATLIEIEDDADDEEDEAPNEQPRPRPPPAPKPAPMDSAQTTPASMSPYPIPSPPVPSTGSLSMPKRRGRPPKHGFGAAGAGDTRDARATPSTRDCERERERTSSTIATPNKGASPMPTGSDGLKPVGHSAFRNTQTGPDGTPLPRKKGRPVGWRKSIHSKEAQARAAGLSPKPTSASRPSASHQSGLRTSLTSNGVVVINSRSPSAAPRRSCPASYNVFNCRWEGCAAQLHNMETLRKHVFKFHRGQNVHKRWPCFWNDCQENERSIDPRTGKPNGFRDEEDFKDHVEFAHLGPKSWELGDGHVGGLSESHDSASEAYLSDNRTGQRVTPLIAAPSQEVIEKAVAAAAAAKAPRGPGRPKLKTDDQKAKEAQTEVEKRKRLIGPGIDRGGARLANEKRRLGFIDDEDFEEVVTDSD